MKFIPSLSSTLIVALFFAWTSASGAPVSAVSAELPVHIAARNALAEQSMAIHFRGRRSPIGHIAAGSVESFLADCHVLSRRGLRYHYGSNKPGNGGLDCSGAVQHLLQRQGLAGVPRQANTQYLWVQKARNLRMVHAGMTEAQLYSQLRPGDLLFWEGTYDVKRSPNITHVMIYVGYDPRSGKHLTFGASGSKVRGLTGHGVDYHEFKGLKPRSRGKFVAFGRAPGLL